MSLKDAVNGHLVCHNLSQKYHKIHRHRFNCHLPGELGVEASFYIGMKTFLSPNQEHQSTEGLMVISFYTWLDAQPATGQPTV